MRYQPEHKEIAPLAFSAIKWLIEKAQLAAEMTENYDDVGMVATVVRSFEGYLPTHMVDSLWALGKLGYKNPHSVDFIGLLDWVSGNQHHHLHYQFGKYRGSSNRVVFYYQVDTYGQLPLHLSE